MIPTYKAGERLRETLRSVLSQDPGPDQMQIEVVDDCSPGASPEAMAREVAGGRVSFFRHDANRGLSGCWNSCVERASGRWVHILHQDDLVLPGFYENLRALIEKAPDAGAAFCRYAVIDGDGHWNSISTVERRTAGVLEDSLARLFSAQRIQCPAIVVRREAYERLGGFSADFPHALDWEMWVRIAAAYPVLYEPRFGACYRAHGESTSASQTRTGENIRDVAKVVRYCARYLPPESAEQLARNTLRFYASTALDTAYAAIWRRDFVTARAQARGALSCDASFRLLARAAFIWSRCLEQELRFGRNPAQSSG